MNWRIRDPETKGGLYAPSQTAVPQATRATPAPVVYRTGIPRGAGSTPPPTHDPNDHSHPELDRQLHLGHRRRRAPRCLRARQVPRRDPADDRAQAAGRGAGARQTRRARHEGQTLDAAGVANQDAALRQVAGQAFHNTSEFTLSDLRARAGRQQLRADFVDYLDGFSPNVQDILDNFEFRNQIPRLDRADASGSLIEKLTSPDINLGPDPVVDPDGAVRHPGLDNHGMGTVFEELIRRFNEENNEEAGEHFTPRDAVTLMARLVFRPIADRIESGTYLLCDGACGTGGMLTVAEDELHRLAEERGKQVSTHLYGQEINAETYAICKADLLLKGEGEAADNIVGGPEHSTLPSDAFRTREFDFMLSNPPYGKSWKTDLQRMGGKKGMSDHRFLIEHSGDPEYSLVTRSSDGQMLFLASGTLVAQVTPRKHVSSYRAARSAILAVASHLIPVYRNAWNLGSNRGNRVPLPATVGHGMRQSREEHTTQVPEARGPDL